MRNLTLFVTIFSSISVCFGAQLWSGSFDYYATSNDMNAWTWDNRAGPWQTYISGPNSISDWISLDPSFKNPADPNTRHGARVLVNGNSIWATGGSELRRTELIPEGFTNSQQTGTLFYQFSMKQTSSNQLLSNFEHQLVFFESHFCDIKYGGDAGALLYFYVNQKVVWSTPFAADVWHNFALQVNYQNNKVGLYHSINGDALQQVVAPISTATSQSDFHLGNLRVPNGNYQAPNNEWVFYSTVSIQNSLIQPFNSASTPSTTGNVGTTGGSTTAAVPSTTRAATTALYTTGAPKVPSTTGSVYTTGAVNLPSTTGAVRTPSTTGSIYTTGSASTTGFSSTVSCALGNQRCIGDSTYQTCTNGNTANFWAASQSCGAGLVCAASSDGNHIYCQRPVNTPSSPVTPPSPATTGLTPATTGLMVQTTGAKAPSTTGAQIQLTTGRISVPPSAPATTGSPIQSSPSASCNFGEMICTSSSTYQQCIRAADGSTKFASVQTCQSSLSCHQNGMYVYCY